MIPISLESSEPGSDGISPSLGTRWYWREKNRKSEHRAEKSEMDGFYYKQCQKILHEVKFTLHVCVVVVIVVVV